MVENPEVVEELLYKLAFGDEYTAADKEILSVFGRTYDAGELIIAEGDDTSDLFLIVSGAVTIVKDYGTGNERRIAMLSAGEVFGEMTYFDNMPRSASVVATVRSMLLLLGREHFDMLFQLHPKWTNTVVTSLCQRLYLAYQDMLYDASEVFVY